MQLAISPSYSNLGPILDRFQMYCRFFCSWPPIPP